MNYLISIILPIYNAEKSLKRTIESIINQSIGFENIELILIDDKSNDNSNLIIQNYANKYSNIIPIFLEKNSGWASIPRNEGIKHSTANYIMFIDSDDEYDENICKQLYKIMETENTDLVSCNYTFKDNISQNKIKFDFESTGENENQIMIVGDHILEFDNIFIWNKIFKRKIIIDNDLTFKECVSEDLIFCIEYLLKSTKRIHLNNYYGYIKYNQNGSLSINHLNLQSFSKYIKSDEFIVDLLRKNIKDPLKLKKIYNNIFKTLLTYRIEEIITLNIDEYKEGIRKLYMLEKKIQFESNLDNPFLNFLNKLILKKKCKLTIIIFKLSKLLFNSKISRKIYRNIVK